MVFRVDQKSETSQTSLQAMVYEGQACPVIVTAWEGEKEALRLKPWPRGKIKNRLVKSWSLHREFAQPQSDSGK